MITIRSTAPQAPLPTLVKIREVAKIFNVSRHTVHNLIESGDLAAAEINPSKCKDRRHVRVTRASLLKFYQKRFGHSLSRALENPLEA